jgi:lipid-A-disaccharide synthase
MTAKPHKRILIVAGETSGDIYASSLIDVMHATLPAELEIFAVGGAQTSKRRVKLLYESTNWAAIGYYEALKRAPQLLGILRKLKRFLEEMRPDLLLLVDYPGFNMRLSRHAKKLGIPTLYYFPPRKFASSADDVRDAAQNIDMVAANFACTYKMYKAAGANVEFVGHPLLDLARPSMPRAEALKEFGLQEGRPIIGLCPGSRKSELDFLLPVMLDAAKLLHARHPNLQFLVPVIKSNGDNVYGIPKTDLFKQLSDSGLPLHIVEGKVYDVMAVSDFLLISSGTATLEATRVGTPMIIVYRVSLFTEILARFFNKIPHFIGLPNIILGRMAIPEMIQRDLTPENLAAKATELLQFAENRDQQRKDLAEAVSHLGSSGAHERVAALASRQLKLSR